MTNQPNLLILDGPRYPTRNPNLAYRGTFRSSPAHFDELPESHEANTLFLWFVNQGGELGVVHELENARRLCELSNAFKRGALFEVIEAVEPEERSAAVTQDMSALGGEFLGFDISQGLNNSLLWSGLAKRVPGGAESPVRALTNTVFRCYSKELNEKGLFESKETASECRAALLALQALEPNLLEGGKLDRFVVVGLFKVG